MMLFLKNRKHRNVGKKLYSPYFDRVLVITAYNSDRRWWFKFDGPTTNKEHRAETRYAYFENHELIVGDN